MGLSQGDQQSVGKGVSLRQSLRTSLIATFIAVFLLLFLISGGKTTAEALISGLVFAIIGRAFTFWILRTGIASDWNSC